MKDKIPAFKSNITLFSDDESTITFFDSRNGKTCKIAFSTLRKFLYPLINGKSTIECIGDELEKVLIFECESLLEEELVTLEQLGVINYHNKKESILHEKYLERFNRQIIFHESQPGNADDIIRLQEKLYHAKILLLGIGGAGSNILHALLGIGVGNITALDYDKIELSNLNRTCFYRSSDIGKLKTDALKSYFSGEDLVRINCIEKKIDSIETLSEIFNNVKPHLVILAADFPKLLIRNWVNRAANRAKLPVFYASGINPSHIFIGPAVIPGITACIDCIERMNVIENETINSINKNIKLGSDITSLQIHAGMFVNEIRDFIFHGKCRLTDCIMKINITDYQIEYVNLRKDDHCQTCKKETVDG